jgi:hypothetical protein
MTYEEIIKEYKERQKKEMEGFADLTHEQIWGTAEQPRLLSS